jgi:hypothetical protein
MAPTPTSPTPLNQDIFTKKFQTIPPTPVPTPVLVTKTPTPYFDDTKFLKNFEIDGRDPTAQPTPSPTLTPTEYVQPLPTALPTPKPTAFYVPTFPTPFQFPTPKPSPSPTAFPTGSQYPTPAPTPYDDTPTMITTYARTPQVDVTWDERIQLSKALTKALAGGVRGSAVGGLENAKVYKVFNHTRGHTYMEIRVTAVSGMASNLMSQIQNPGFPRAVNNQMRMMFNNKDMALHFGTTVMSGPFETGKTAPIVEVCVRSLCIVPYLTATCADTDR